MAKPVGHRRPRKEVPDDMVSCPPTLNLKKESGKKTKQFINELVEMSPQLSEMGEKDTKGEEDSALALASMMQSTVSSLGTPVVSKPSGKKIRPAKEVKERNMREFKTSSRAPPPLRSSSKEVVSPLSQQVRPQHNKSTAQRSNRAAAVKPAQQKVQESGFARPRNYRSRRNPSIYSSVHSSLGSSLISFDSMSQSVYSVYTTATIISRRPAWGHYVVGVMVFLGWIVHHYYFSEYFQPLYAQTTKTLHQSLVKDISLDAIPSSSSSPSMLRGAIIGSAVYLQQDYEKRDDYLAVKPVDSAFDTIEGEERFSKKINSVPSLEEEADAEADPGEPPPPVSTTAAAVEPNLELKGPGAAEEEATKKDTDGEKSFVS